MSETITRTYRHRLYPTRRQSDALTAQLAFACDLYNAALEQRRTAWSLFGVSVTRADQERQLTELRRDGQFPAGQNAVSQHMVLQRLDLAVKAFFRRVKAGEAPGFPRYKSRQRFNTLAWRSGKAGGAAIVNDRLRIQGVGHIKVKWHRDLPGEVRQTRITRRNGRWYVAFTVRMAKPAPLPATGEQVGVDLGVRQFATLSTGEAIHGPRAGRVAAPEIRRAQRKVARRKRGSNRRRKAVAELARRREREANRRRDAAHKAARSLINRFDLIAVEDLKTSNMVRTRRGLAREITDQGWSQFIEFLTYKAESAGRQVVRVDPRYTSQRCHECGVRDRESRSGPRFACTACGHTDDADVNAARNILALARTGPSGVNPTERSRVA
ncbi:MAG TPA: transposase [Solirubrobacterales bacterium]|nr:transposase [Solirubrobacterales bacterium]